MPKLGEIGEDYQPDRTIFRRDDMRTHRVKEVIASRLTEVDRRIILLYAETGSVRDTAALLGCSRSEAQRHIQRIRNLIINEINKKK